MLCLLMICLLHDPANERLATIYCIGTCRHLFENILNCEVNIYRHRTIRLHYHNCCSLTYTWMGKMIKLYIVAIVEYGLTIKRKDVVP